MSAIANFPAKVIWLVEHYTDSSCLLGSILQKWHYRVIRILDSEVLAGEIEFKSHFSLPCLIVLDIAPPQGNVMELIKYFRQNVALSNIPLLCLCTSRKANRMQAIEAEASNVLNKPFELNELYLQLKVLLARKADVQQSESKPSMTLVLTEIEPNSLIKEQEYWSKIFEEHSEEEAWQLLIAAGYEVKIPFLSIEK